MFDSLFVCSVSEKFGPSVVVHTSVPFGMDHLEDATEEVQAIILEELQKLMPGLPEPESIKCQKWRYSQVRKQSLPVILHLFISQRYFIWSFTHRVIYYRQCYSVFFTLNKCFGLICLRVSGMFQLLYIMKCYFVCTNRHSPLFLIIWIF